MSILLKKTIEILEIDARLTLNKISPDLEEARALALSGLKAISYVRHGGSWHPTALLPGEFPEQLKL